MSRVPSAQLGALASSVLLNGGVITWTNSGQPFCDTQASQAGACGA